MILETCDDNGINASRPFKGVVSAVARNDRDVVMGPEMDGGGVADGKLEAR